jgi:hypothetical protein
MNLSLKEEAFEILMPGWMPGSCRGWQHDIRPAGDIPGRVSARASRHLKRYPAAAGALGHTGDDHFPLSVTGNRRKSGGATPLGLPPRPEGQVFRP